MRGGWDWALPSWRGPQPRASVQEEAGRGWRRRSALRRECDQNPAGRGVEEQADVQRGCMKMKYENAHILYIYL